MTRRSTEMERRAVLALDDLLGYVTMTPMGPAVYGQQLPDTLIQRFDKHGVCVERRIVPPAITIIYD